MRISLLVYLTITTALLSNNVDAYFYIWHDEKGVKHVSNIPRECINENKTVALACLWEHPSKDVKREGNEWITLENGEAGRSGQEEKRIDNENDGKMACTLADYEYKKAMANYDNLPIEKKSNEARFILYALAFNADDLCK